MQSTNIDPDRKVSEILEEYPESYQVLREYGCPDMKQGVFSMMSRIMSLRNAARIHRIPLDELLNDLEKKCDGVQQ